MDWEKPIQTRDGRKARLLGIIHSSPDRESHIVSIEGPNGYEEDYSFYPNGRYNKSQERDRDIINVPETVERWVNVYEDEDNFVEYQTKERANQRADEDRIGLVKLTIIDGKLESADVVKDEAH